MTGIDVVEWGGRREPETPTEREVEFVRHLMARKPDLDYWLHEDADGTPWMIVSLDFVRRGPNHGRGTLRMDFDERGIRGGWSPASLNWDDGMRAEDAAIFTGPPQGINVNADGHSLESLAELAADWFSRTRWARRWWWSPR